MSSIDDALKTLPAKVRDAFYIAQIWLSVFAGAALTALTIWTAATEQPAPLWFTITLAVLAFFGILPGRTSRANLTE